MLAGGIGCSRSQEASLGTVGGTITLDGSKPECNRDPIRSTSSCFLTDTPPL